MNTKPTDSGALSEFTRGIEEHMETGVSPVATSLSDRELASIAWPGKDWSDLSPEACEEAINGKLNDSTQDNARTN